MEDSFYFTVSIIAILILIIVMTYVGVLLYTSKPTAVFPETVSKCPDYWEVDSSGKCKVPPGTTNTKNAGDMDWIAPTNRQLKTDGSKISEIASLIDNSTYTNPAYSLLDVSDASWNAISSIAGVNTGSALCKKARWACSRGIVWQGVSNTNAC